jgi:hypothetical protein
MTLWYFSHEADDRLRCGVVGHAFDWWAATPEMRARESRRILEEVKAIARRSFTLGPTADLEVYPIPPLSPGEVHHLVNLELD